MAVCLDQALRRFLSAWGLKSLFLASLRDRWYTFRSYCLAYIPAIPDASWDSREVLERGLRWIGLSEARISELSDAWVSYLGGLGVCGVSGVPAGAGVVSGKEASEDHESSAAYRKIGNPWWYTADTQWHKLLDESCVFSKNYLQYFPAECAVQLFRKNTRICLLCLSPAGTI